MPCDGRDFIFLQDNILSHTSTVAINFLDTKGVNVLGWPECFLDVNTIENLGDILKSRMSICEDNSRNGMQLTQAAIQEWDNLNQKTIVSLISCMN